MKFFEIYSQWHWPNPVMLHDISTKPDLKFDVWDAPNKSDDFSHVMPIISPAYPAWNLSACVSESTLRVMKEEFRCANDTCKVSYATCKSNIAKSVHSLTNTFVDHE
jgi:poly(A) polymerase